MERRRQGPVQHAKRLTSGVKRVDTGVYDAIQQMQQGKFKGGSDLLFTKNGGMSVSKINPAVPGVHRQDEHVQAADHQRHAQGPERALRA
jgi:basic membrane lipoprotein Med (substrate-binding protein (PBP1-ABC) superfamily)